MNFFEIVDRISKLMDDSSYGVVSKARRLPTEYVDNIKTLKVEHRYYGNRIPDEHLAAMEQVKTAMCESERARGEADRNQKLLAISAELESLRAILPNLAAKMAIEVGKRARALADEAST